MMDATPIQPLYTETQTRKPLFVWPIVLLVAVIGWVILFLGLTSTPLAGAP